jgi:hypothetical protein
MTIPALPSKSRENAFNWSRDDTALARTLSRVLRRTNPAHTPPEYVSQVLGSPDS